MKYDELENTVSYLSDMLAVVIAGGFSDIEDELIEEIYPYMEAAFRSGYIRGRFDASLAHRDIMLEAVEAIDEDSIEQVRQVFGADDKELNQNRLAVKASWDLIPEELHGWFEERIK